MSLTKIHFQTKVIQFANAFMYNYDHNMLGDKIKETNLSSCNKWQGSYTMPLCHVVSSSDRAYIL